VYWCHPAQDARRDNDDRICAPGSRVLALVMVSSLLFWCWRKTSKGDWPRYSAVLAMIFLFNEAFVGAMLVVFGHVAQDQSAGHALLLCLHFANTLLLLASLSLTAQWLSNGDRRFAVIGKPRELTAIGLGLAAVMSTGITGSLPALGDTIFPATSLRSSLIQDFSSSGHGLVQLRVLHPVAAVMGVIYGLWIVLKSSGEQMRLSWRRRLLIGTLALQVGLGITNVVLLESGWLRGSRSRQFREAFRIEFTGFRYTQDSASSILTLTGGILFTRRLRRSW
jgi:heme a synthase